MTRDREGLDKDFRWLGWSHGRDEKLRRSFSRKQGEKASACVVGTLQCGQCQNLSDDEPRMGEQCKIEGTGPEGWTEDASSRRERDEVHLSFPFEP